MTWRNALVEALNTDTSLDDLRGILEELIAQGASPREIYDALDDLRVELREKGLDRLEDVVLDTQDLLEGWANPAATISTASDDNFEETLLFGRAELLDELSRAEASLLLVVADSGVGKSALLERIQDLAGEFSPSPIALHASDGAIQAALLDALATVVADYHRRHPSERIVGRVVSAATNLAKNKANELFRVVGRELLALLRSRLGDDFGSAAAEYAQLLWNDQGDVERRLTQARNPMLAETIARFAGEVATICGGTGIAIALDNAELLPEGEARL